MVYELGCEAFHGVTQSWRFPAAAEALFGLRALPSRARKTMLEDSGEFSNISGSRPKYVLVRRRMAQPKP